MKTSKLYVLVISAALAAASLSGCNRGPDPAKVREDVAKAQADGQKKIADAQAKLEKAQAEARKDAVTDPNAAGTATPGAAPAPASGDAKKIADAQYDLDKARAEAAYDVAKAQCESQSGDAEKSCKDSAKAQYDSAVAAAKQKNEQVKG